MIEVKKTAAKGVDMRYRDEGTFDMRWLDHWLGWAERSAA